MPRAAMLLAVTAFGDALYLRGAAAVTARIRAGGNPLLGLLYCRFVSVRIFCLLGG